MARRLAVAEDLGQRDIVAYLHKLMRSIAAADGRVNMVYEIAKQEEAANVASEIFAPRKGV